MILNYMEVLVDEIFNEVRSLYERCISEKCIHDIKSTALNNLPTQYFTFEAEESEMKAFLLDRQRRITVLAQIAEAADTICSYCKTNNK